MAEDIESIHTADRAEDAIRDLFAAEEAAALAEIMHEEDEMVELTDSEVNAVAALHANLSLKYKYQQGTYANIQSMRHEYEDEFRKLGFDVEVDHIMRGLAIDPAMNPITVTITARLTPMDRQKFQDEARAGVADAYYDKKRKHAPLKKK